jgi:hypothetical protein
VSKFKLSSIVIAIAVVLLTTAFVVFDNPCGGKERWDVKTLTDTAVSRINFKPKSVTIERLIQTVPGRKIGNNTPRFGLEFNVCTVICKIREYRTEDDGDKHLVLVSTVDSTVTMIGEIPNLMCDTTNSNKFRPKFDSCLAEFKKYTLKNYKVKPGKYKVTGVIFYDKIHGQLGVAPNGIELHPILSIKKVK